MQKLNALLIILTITLFTACTSPDNKTTTTPSPASILPTGWKILQQEQDMLLASITRKYLNKNTTDSYTDYVIIADLKSGAAIRPLQKPQTDTSASPTFFSYSVTDTVTGHPSFWNLFHNQATFAITNLDFFNFSGNQAPTAQLCYPLYYQGRQLSCGCVHNCCIGDDTLAQRVVLIADTGITVARYNGSDSMKKIMAGKTIIAALVGNAPIVNRSGEGNSSVGRAYMGINGANLIIYCSPHSTEQLIDSLIRTQFKVAPENVVMFDGGGSTQMICKGIPYLPSPSHRLVPSALEVFHRQPTAAK